MTTRRLVTGVVSGIVLGAVGVLSPTAAIADPEVPSGVYKALATHQPDRFAPIALTWTFTPCGPECITAHGDWKAENWEFHLSNGRWIYHGQIDQECDPGVTVPETVNVSFDAVTLAGDAQLAYPTGCGSIRPGTAMQYELLLSKAG